MWSKSFLQDEQWETIRSVMPEGILRNWNQLSETTKRKSVERCAQQLLETISTDSDKQDPIFENIKSGAIFEPELEIGDIPRIMPKVLPYGEDLDYMETADPGLSGEIELDVNGKLLTRYLRLTNFVKFLKDNYDHWLNNELIPLINHTRVKIRGGTIVFADAMLMPPTIDSKKLYPSKARENGITYGLDLYATIYLDKVNPEGTIERTVLADGTNTRKKLGQIPLMLDSKRCYLHNMSPEELRRVGEDPSDPFGYFVVAGSDFVVMMQEKLRINRIFVTLTKKTNSEFSSKASMTIEMPSNSVRVQLTIGKFKQILFETRYQIKDFTAPEKSKPQDTTEEEEEEDVAESEPESEVADLEEKKSAFIIYKRGNNYRQIGIEKLFYLLRVFEIEESLDKSAGESIYNAELDKDMWADDMTEQIVQFTKKEWKSKIRIATNILRFLYPSESQSIVISEVATIKGGATAGDFESEKHVVKKMLMNDLFPQVNNLHQMLSTDNVENMPSVFKLKADMLAIMTCRLLECDLGLAPYDDRDSWTNKRLFDASQTMGQLFRALWNDMKKNIKEKFSETKSINSVMSINEAIKKVKITEIFWNSFKNSNWGMPGALKENIKQAFNKTSIVSMYSHMMRINVQANTNDKVPDRRMVAGTQFGYICPSESPEGRNCGLVKNMAITAQVTHNKLDYPVLYKIFNSEYFSFAFSPTYSSPVLVNGKFIGLSQGQELKDELVTNL
jgi:DNA-directed RNA polymerase beta subunit